MDRATYGPIMLIAALGVTVGAFWYLAKVAKIPWFRSKYESQDRWTVATGMLPIAIPVYLGVGLIMSAFGS